ncbi:unnamed protein product [Peronospora belbahrii]|uniref:Major facilitator superfamily (MFS) profile domain-containing protein n=1 Tax=Peronospora belbahrii TaxID=622444 RepID=A0AAU9L9F0_9STRA|nr:unnamed protein product [Peronospora belbahrii]
MDDRALIFGLLMSVYGFLQFFTAPIVGSLSDSYGPLFKHSLEIIKLTVTDGEQIHKRTASIGKLNAATNAGFIIGPIIGGYRSRQLEYRRQRL